MNLTSIASDLPTEFLLDHTRYRVDETTAFSFLFFLFFFLSFILSFIDCIATSELRLEAFGG